MMMAFCWLWKWMWCSWVHRRHRCYPEVWDRGLDGPWHCAECHPCSEVFDVLEARHDRRYIALEVALTSAKADDQQLQKLICDFFPVGAQIRWKHGDSIRSGIVKEFSGISADMLRFNIESDKSGRTCWIGAGRLLSFVGLTV